MEQALPGGGEVFIESSRVARFSKKIEPFSAISFAPFHFSHFQFDGTTFFSCFRVDRRVRYVLAENQVVFYFLSPQFFALRCIISNLLFFYFLFFVFLLEFSTIRRPMSPK